MPWGCLIVKFNRDKYCHRTLQTKFAPCFYQNIHLLLFRLIQHRRSLAAAPFRLEFCVVARGQFTLDVDATVNHVVVFCPEFPKTDSYVRKGSELSNIRSSTEQCRTDPGHQIWNNIEISFLFILIVIIVHKDVTGIWWEDRFRPYVYMLPNAVRNVVLVQIIGISSIILSVVFYLAISIPWENYTIFKYVFHRSSKAYYGKVFFEAGTMVFASRGTSHGKEKPAYISHVSSCGSASAVDCALRYTPGWDTPTPRRKRHRKR